MQIVTNAYPHNWAYQLNFVDGPFRDVRVRRAANYALNRPDFKELLGGVALEAYANLPPLRPSGAHEFDQARARALLTEAGCMPCKITLAISTSGSGQMQPLPMNELVKSQLEAAGFEVTLDVMDWNALLQVDRDGREKHQNVDGLNISRSLQDPFNGMMRFVWTQQLAPRGS